MAVSNCIVTPIHVPEKPNTRSLAELRAEVHARIAVTVAHIRLLIMLEDMR